MKTSLKINMETCLYSANVIFTALTGSGLIMKIITGHIHFIPMCY